MRSTKLYIIATVVLIQIIIGVLVIDNQSRKQAELKDDNLLKKIPPTGKSMYFLEELRYSSDPSLINDMDYLAPDVSQYIIDQKELYNILIQGRSGDYILGIVPVTETNIYGPMLVRKIRLEPKDD